MKPKAFDPFDFDNYPDDHKLFETYFADAELYLNLANWINYKYAWLKSEKERTELDNELKKSKAKREFLNKITAVYSPEDVLMQWYNHFEPSKANSEHIDLITTKYSSDYPKMWKNLYHKYVTEAS
jgi:hypothetical protein